MCPLDEQTAAELPQAAAASAPLPLFAMARFRRLMSVHGWAVDLARMCTDAAYVYECLARAHSCGEERLRGVALLLFASYDAQRAGSPAH